MSTAETLMQQFGQALFIVGLLIAFIVGIGSNNIPVMFVVLEMSPDLSHGQWLLVTLTAGVGGSMLSIGSAAGVGISPGHNLHSLDLMPLLMPPVYIGLFHKPDLRMSGLSQAPIADYGAEGDTELGSETTQ